MPNSIYLPAMRRIEEDIPDTWQMFGTVIFSDGTKYILWRIHLEPSDYQLQFADISCDEEWTYARDTCDKLLNQHNPPRGLTGGYKSLGKCMKGLVSARCGGNPV